MESNRPEQYSISCVIPAFNEGDGITEFLHELHEMLHSFAERVEISAVKEHLQRCGIEVRS